MDNELEILSDEDCYSLLESGTIGRIAISVAALPAVLPVRYEMVDGAIVFETSEGAKLRAALQHTVVAFQVDSIDPEVGGWSVLAVGIAQVVTDDSVLARVRACHLRPFGRDEETRMVAIRPDFVSGRRFAAPS